MKLTTQVVSHGRLICSNEAGRVILQSILFSVRCDHAIALQLDNLRFDQIGSTMKLYTLMFEMDEKPPWQNQGKLSWCLSAA